MKSKWEPILVRVTPQAIPGNHYEQRIAEITEVLYGLFCQLDETHSKPPIETRTSPSSLQKPPKSEELTHEAS